ncbi:hypothetical protein C8J55DRAFT_217072 [Lentinula edodes]|uniref:Uncharacterized protein n=1 Tax=Lentinula lateritia TaxID=40482 RepID=A0A9W9AZ61_9AGAR|nr:hypothetical protein C8J55DRAFT_217072 [Lentinula edodes]
MFPITSYFQRKTKKENVNPPKKRKQILPDDDEISLQPSGSSKKAKVDTPRRQQLSNRTKSLNKEGFNAAASSSTSARRTETISRRTPPHHHYATPQSLARASSSNTGYTSDGIIDLTTGPSGSTQPQLDSNANPFLIQTPRPLPSMIVQPAPASSVHPPIASSPRRFRAVGTFYSEMTPSSLPSIRQALSRSLATITPNTPKRSSNHANEIVPATPESPSLRLPIVQDEFPDLSVPSSQSQEAEMDFLINRKSKALTPDATNELDDLSSVPTSQSQEVEIDLYVHRKGKGVSLAADATTGDELFDLSQVPTSQSQEVEVNLSVYRRYNVKEHHGAHPSSDEIVPCSQSQDFDGIFLEAVSPRRKRILRELEQARQGATATDLSSGSGSRSSPTGCDESQSVFHSPGEVQSITDEAVKSPMLSHGNIIPYAAQETISESPNIKRPESTHAMVPINDEDIQSLFEIELPSMPPSQAASVTESDSGDEQWMLQGLHTDAHQPVLTSEVYRDPARPLTQPEVQSWQTDVSAYSYPRDVLDFLDMLEGGPD